MPKNGFIDYAAGGNNNFQDFQDLAKREIIEFAREHEGDDTARLLLGAARYPHIDMAAAVQQIEGRRTAREKWPSLLECPDFVYPPRLNREQSSSEATALHKAGIILRHLGETPARPLRIADLTGGMGIDTFALAGWGAEETTEVEVDYVEQDKGLCDLARHNANALGLHNIRFHCADSSWGTRASASTHSNALVFNLCFIFSSVIAISGCFSVARS